MPDEATLVIDQALARNLDGKRHSISPGVAAPVCHACRDTEHGLTGLVAPNPCCFYPRMVMSSLERVERPCLLCMETQRALDFKI